MADQTNTAPWPSGTRIAVLDRTRTMRGVIRYQGPACEEDAMPTYRVAFDGGLEAEMCQSVLVRTATNAE